MNRQTIPTGIAAFLFLLFCLLFLSCGEEPGNTANTGINQRIIISGEDLTELIQLPSGGQRRQTTMNVNEQYSAIFDWYDSFDGGNTFNDAIGVVYYPDYIYCAEITLRAQKGYTFKGTEENSFSHYKAASVLNPAGTGTSLKISVVFPVTPNENDIIVTATNLTFILVPPVKHGIPYSTLNYTQYQANIAWESVAGENVEQFLPSSSYKAIINLIPKSGYTFTGLTDDSFSHSSALNVEFDILNSNLTIEFKPTTAEGVEETVSAYNLTDLIPVPIHRAAPLITFASQQYSGNINWFYTESGSDNPVTGGFPCEKPIKAVISLDPEDGFTFNGVLANAFLHDGSVLVSYAAGADTITITFSAPVWKIGSVIFPSLAAKTIKACCSRNMTDRHVSNLISGDFDGVAFWEHSFIRRGGNGVLHVDGEPDNFNVSTFSAWPEIIEADMWRWPSDPHYELSGHRMVFNAYSVPAEIRYPASVITLDLGSVWDDIVMVGFYPRRDGGDAINEFVHHTQIFYSLDYEIPAIFNPNDSRIGKMPIHEFPHYGSPGFPHFPPYNWRYIDLTQYTEEGRGISARYIHIRFYSNMARGLGDDWNCVSFSQLRIGQMVDD